MFSILFSMIPGVSLGIQIFCTEEEMDTGDMFAIMLDLFIVRITYIHHKDDYAD